MTRLLALLGTALVAGAALVAALIALSARDLAEDDRDYVVTGI